MAANAFDQLHGQVVDSLTTIEIKYTTPAGSRNHQTQVDKPLTQDACREPQTVEHQQIKPAPTKSLKEQIIGEEGKSVEADSQPPNDIDRAQVDTPHSTNSPSEECAIPDGETQVDEPQTQDTCKESQTGKHQQIKSSPDKSSKEQIIGELGKSVEADPQPPNDIDRAQVDTPHSTNTPRAECAFPDSDSTEITDEESSNTVNNNLPKNDATLDEVLHPDTNNDTHETSLHHKVYNRNLTF